MQNTQALTRRPGCRIRVVAYLRLGLYPASNLTPTPRMMKTASHPRSISPLSRNPVTALMRAGLAALTLTVLGTAFNPAYANSTVGAWGAVRSLPYRPVHSILLPNGKVLLYPAGDDPRLWDPLPDTLVATPKFTYNPFCSSHAHLADGRVLIAGGHIANNIGLPNTAIYDPVANTFTRMQDMNAGRWYPSLVTLGNGDQVVMSGDDENAVRNLIPQVWQQSSNSWRSLTGASLSIGLYPAVFLAPNGKVFLATSTSRYLDTAGSGGWTTVGNRIVGGRDNYGSAVMYEVGKVIYTGGSDAPVATTEMIDLNAPTPAWTAMASMPQVRRQHNATVLPDGRVLVTGGSSASGFNTDDGPKAAIVWNPASNTWTTWATENDYRGYHSEAVLLPDGRVASIGGDGHNNLQVFSPPYLFQGARPTITSAPASVQLGQTFFVETPDGASITKVTWTRLSAVTHTKNMGQRINTLGFSTTGGGLNITAPTDANHCPVGYYMLWLINGSGVPSVSAMVRVDPAGAAQPPPPPTALVATPGNGQVSLSWNASSGATSYNVKRSTTSGGPYSTIATGVASTSFLDTTVVNGTTYYYVVTAVNAAGESGNSNQASATPQLQPPGAPTDLVAVGLNNRVDLSWNAPSGGATSYRVKRATTSGGPYSNLNTNVAATSYSDTTAVNGTTYYYVVSAQNAAGEGPNSAQASATPQPPPPAPSGLTATPGDTQVSLLWNTAGGASEYHVHRSLTSGGPYETIAFSLSTTTFLDTGLNNGTTYFYVVTAVNPAGSSPNSSEASATPAPGIVPAPWQTQDIGAVGAAGSASFSSGTFTVVGSGADIWGTADEFRYVFQPANGDCEIRARVTGIQNTHTWAKSGVMIRETLATGSKHAMVVLTPGQGVSFQRRGTNDATSLSTTTAGLVAPQWVRVVRRGNVFSGYRSTDGVNWTLMGTETITMGSSVYVGLAVTSHNDGVLCSSTLDNVRPSVGLHTASAQIIHDAGRNKVWNVNPDANTVTRIDGVTRGKDFEIAVGAEPRSLALRPGGAEVWVVSEGSDQIHVLNADTGGVLATLATGRGTRPMGIAFAPDGSAAYVTYMGSGRLAKWNPSTRAETATLDVSKKPRGLAITADSSRLFVGRFVSPVDAFNPLNEVGEVREVSAATFTVTRTLTLAHDTTPDSESSGRGTPNYLIQMAISPDGERLWVPSKKDNVDRGTGRDGLALTQDNTVRSIFSKFDLINHVEVSGGRKDVDDSELPHGVAFSPAGNLAFIAYQGNNVVKVFNADNNALVTTISLGAELAPQDLVVTPDGSRLFVHNFMTRSVSAFDIAALVDGSSTTATALGTTSVVAAELLAPNVLLGKKIFYNAADTRMSLQGYISCATCHLDGGSDERVWDFKNRGEGFRNTARLQGKAGMGQGNVHWTANFDEIQDFEHDIRNGFGGSGFITGAPNDPLGAPNAGRSADLDALAAYVASLSGVGKSPNRNGDGTLTADGLAGRTLFQQLNCNSCHSGNHFTDSIVSSTSPILHNVGTIKATSGNRIGGPLTGLDTPTLKGIWSTGPYLHDGSAQTLLEVLTTQNPGDQHGVTSTLTTTQRNQLVAYLLQIDDDEPAPPTGPAVPTYVGAGNISSGTGTITPSLPSGLASGDVLLLFVETANQAVSISNPNGGAWAEVAGSPQGTGSAGGTSATRLTVFWSRYNGTQGNPTVSDSGNHQIARMIAIRGAAAAGDPWDVTAGGIETTSDTSASIPGVTTTVDNTLVVVAVAGSLPDANGTANFSAWSNANLANLTERTDDTRNSGNGGALGIATGEKATAGATGNTAVTHASAAIKGLITIAIKP
jgi:DNA-binding beta-propeller fold protein YncE/fibronectin type 3 domain-containing protein